MELQQKYDKHSLITQILEVACQLKYDSQHYKNQAVDALELVIERIELG